MSGSFHDKLRRAWRAADSALCVGLDPRPDRLPERCRSHRLPFFAFCRQVVDATAELVCAYKPQIACFAASGREEDLAETIAYIHEVWPNVTVILDAKRGDIGATAVFYADEAFERYGADAVTVNPYLGWDAIAPFAERAGHGALVLCHTSNPDSGWLQDYPPDDPTYLRVADMVAAKDRENLGLVVGATFPEQLAAVRRRAPELPLLVPGIGAQGGDIDAVFVGGVDDNGGGLVINASRSIIFAAEDENWASAAQSAATSMRDAMRRARDTALSLR